jgi:hypothetical protein
LIEVAKLLRILDDESASKDLVMVKPCPSADTWTHTARKNVNSGNVSVPSLWSMLYADDAAIVSVAELTGMMTNLVEVTSQFGLLVSEKKSQTMCAASEKQLQTGRVVIKHLQARTSTSNFVPRNEIDRGWWSL